MYIILRKFKAD